MIQDILPKKFNNTFDVNASPCEKDFIIIYRNGGFLLKINEDDSSFSFPECGEFSNLPEAVYFYSIDGERFFYAYGAFDEKTLPEGYEYYDLKHLRSKYYYPKHYMFAAYTAYQLIDWYESNRFCGKCGEKNALSKSERALVCPVCGKVRYPRINPAVIVGVINGDKILLIKYRTGFAHNALVAGFTEIGETVEETVIREVMEETGLKVKNIRYYKSQPWGIASDILMGFFCDVDGNTEIAMDSSELKYAEWVTREDIVLQPLDYSLTNEMMRLFKEGVKI